MTLIFPRGYKEFQDKCYQWEPGKKSKEQHWSEKGFQPTQGSYSHKGDDVTSQRVWNVPANFCPDCGRKSIDQDNQRRGRPGMFCFPEPHPELRLNPGDVIMYHRCGDCANESLFNEQPSLVYPDGAWDRLQHNTQARIEQHLQGYIKSRILAGEEPSERR